MKAKPITNINVTIDIADIVRVKGTADAMKILKQVLSGVDLSKTKVSIQTK